MNLLATDSSGVRVSSIVLMEEASGLTMSGAASDLKSDKNLIQNKWRDRPDSLAKSCESAPVNRRLPTPEAGALSRLDYGPDKTLLGRPL